VSDETLLAGLDWLLGSAPDERRVDTGPVTGTVPAAFLDRTLAAARDRLAEAERSIEIAESALARTDRESRERLEALERADRESRERGEALERLAAEAREVASSLEEARARGPLGALLPSRWLRLHRAAGAAVARLRGLVG